MKPQQEEILISQVHTSCHSCVFAEYDHYNVQQGCRMNKIQQYRDAGVKILDVYAAKTNKSHYLIDGRFCMFFRNPEVMSNHDPKNWEKIVKQQVKVPYHLILMVNDDTTLEQVQENLRNLKYQYVQPKFITLVNKQYHQYSQNPDKYIKPSSLLFALQEIDFIAKYSLRNIYDENLSDREIIDLVFDSTNKLPLPFYLVFNANFKIHRDFTRQFNTAIFDKMLQIGFAKPIDNINGMIVNHTTHKKHAGNSFGILLEDKILKFENNGEQFIMETKDICPSISYE